ncbi:MAG: FGGY-family carbohydrate kinase [Gammaproteobacteria bacterium]|nr:FGGY-family carbohydrate kinase [Gammaproteobacteria bacterium]
MTDSAPLLLAIDNGTQSVRALLFTPEGVLVHKAQVPLTPYHSPEPGWAENDAEYYWESLAAACRKLWDESGVDKSRVLGLAVTTQRGTVINVDAAGQPLRPAMVWPDKRRTEGLKPPGGLWGLAFRLAGVSDTVKHFQAEAEASWLRTHQPEIWAKTHKYLLLSGWLNYRLTGEFVDSSASQVGYLPFDFKKKTWPGSRDWRWGMLDLHPEQMPELFAPGTQLGVVSAQASTQTGIPAGLPVFAGAADKACEVLGSGCLEPQVGCLSFGTTATINVSSRRYVEPVPFLPPYPAAAPEHYAVEWQLYRGFWMVSWFKEQFGLREQQLAADMGVAPEALFDELVNSVPPGSQGLMLQPYWTPGVREPGPEGKGAIIGFGDVHGRAHVYRAILEGLAYGLRDGKERIEKRTGVAITELRVSGGGSQSDAAMQLTADIFGLPAARPETHETSGLGAAMDVAVGLGLHRDFASALAAMTRIGRVFDPEPQTHALYDQLYTRVYRKMYERMRPLYQAIREITGYPA